MRNTPILDAMILCMQDVLKKEGSGLYMSAFFKNIDEIPFINREDGMAVKDSTTVNECGSAACVLGWCILDPRVRMVSGTNVPQDLWKALEAEIGEVAADSIVAPFANFRKKRANWLPATSHSMALLQHNHVNSESSINDALDYLVVMKAHIGEANERV
ncbi:hypothetical protein [Alteromonas sp. RKMC-009]|uniref:hypothetical protein n=1 Tax=Alteromonas sp. RKMC-009 TaxID=2267264 RepID=UPI000E684AF2|nr:hypothetical protein [Alteromonas sp. RKMC-009]AYA64291.1 hypothetical protein DS731_09950 [Alteromonas sp. RKMC-009]